VKRLAALAALVAMVLSGLVFVISPFAADASGFKETIFVDSRNPNPVQTVGTLTAGTPYTLTVSGTYNMGFNNSIADAECASFPPDPTFQPSRYSALEPTGDIGDLYVNNGPVQWTPTVPDAFGCNSTTHVYTYTYTPAVNGKLKLGVHELDAGGHTDNTGALKVVITEAKTVLERFTIPADNRNGITSSTVVSPTKTYMLEVKGTYVWNKGNLPGGVNTPGQTGAGLLTADAECTYFGQTPGVQNFFGTVQTPTDMNDDMLDVHINDAPVAWVANPINQPPAPPIPPANGCDDSGHVYTFTFKPSVATALKLSIKDEVYEDNSGSLSATLYEVAVGTATTSTIDVPVPELVLAEEFKVDSRNPQGANSATAFQPGKTYLVEAKGTYNWGAGLGDAECTTGPGDGIFVPDRFHFLDQNNDIADLVINNQFYTWIPLVSTVEGCDETTHTYRVAYQPQTPGLTNFKIFDGFHGDNSGELTVRVYLLDQPAPAGQQVDTFNVFAASPTGTTSNVVLSNTYEYSIEVSGSYVFNNSLPPGVADAECMRVQGGPGSRDAAGALTPFDPADDLLDVYVNGSPVDWTPTKASPAGCNDQDATYTYKVKPAASSKINLRVQDTVHADNSGVLKVTIRKLFTSSPPTGATSVPQVSLVEQVEVDSRSSSGTNSTVPVRPGEQLVLEASGTYVWGNGRADAECSTANNDQVYRYNRFESQAPGTDLTDVMINNSYVAWAPNAPDAEGCSADHIYRITYTVPTAGVINFRMADSVLGDNSGKILVKIFRIEEIPLGTMKIAGNDTDGELTVPLIAGRTYRLRARGEYVFWNASSNNRADAECTTVDGATYLHDRYGFVLPSEDIADLYVNNRPVVWKPVSGTGTCDPNHEYDFEFTPIASGPGNLRIFDTVHHDNTGELTVDIFMKS
jgi:hypothetical protein